MQLEPIIAAKLRNFQERFELSNIQDGVAFGKFVNHTILSTHQPDAFSADSELLEKISVDGEWDTGIDGMAIMLNGLVIKDQTDVDSIMNQFRFVAVEFIFIQSKYSSGFDSAGFLKFIAGVRDFLNEKSKLPQNDRIKESFELKTYILSDQFISKWDSNPKVKLYYVSMGRWKKSNTHLLGLAEQAIEDINTLNTYETPEINFIDSEGLKGLCDLNDNRFDVTMAAYDIMELTPVDKVDNSCIAVCYGTELLKMLKTDSDEIRKSLFDDNVRDYQGENAVNSEIYSTIQREPSKFILFNNGITIVCDEFKTSTKKITIKNPMIVNGCQTSHVIFNAYKKGLDISKIPINIKVIWTRDINITNDVVRSTNRQSQVLEESFETTKPFHQRLEEFFNAYSSQVVKLYYERRSKQYRHLHTVKNTEIINLQVLLHSFVGMMLNSPHMVKNSTLAMLKDLKGSIFLESQSYLPYYTSSLTFYQMERLFRSGFLSKEMRSYKPHLLMIFREAVAGTLPPINDQKLIDDHAKKILEVVSSEESCKSYFKKVAEIFNESRKIWITELKRDKYGMKDVAAFTNLLLKNIRKEYSVKAVRYEDSSAIYVSEVSFTLKDKKDTWCGFIIDEPQKMFFHEFYNKDLDFKSLKGKKVEYKVAKDKKGSEKEYAYDVRVID
jgi:hypothetical protein